MSRLAAVLALVVSSGLVSSGASGGELRVKSVKANSTLPDKDGESYAETNVLDDKAGTYWAEGKPDAGMGTMFTVNFDGQVTLSKIKVWNGCWQTADLWKRMYRVKEIELKYPDFTYERLTIPDGQEPQVISLKEPKKLDNVKLVIKGVYDGTTFQDTAISEIRFLDDSPSALVGGAQASASSELPPEKDNLDLKAYAAVKATDGFVDTYWCENTPGKGGPGQGIGEWLRVDLGSAVAVKTMRIAIGNGFDQKSFVHNSRPLVLKAEFSDGSVRELTLEDRPGLQDVDLGGKSLSWVKLTIVKVAEGTRWNDTAIAEVQFVR